MGWNGMACASVLEGFERGRAWVLLKVPLSVPSSFPASPASCLLPQDLGIDAQSHIRDWHSGLVL